MTSEQSGQPQMQAQQPTLQPLFSHLHAAASPLPICPAAPSSSSTCHMRTGSLSVFTLEPKQIRINKKSFDSFVKRNTEERDKDRQANEFVRRVRNDKARFEGHMFLIKKREEHHRKLKEGSTRQQLTDRRQQHTRNKREHIFDTLDQINHRKHNRSHEMTKFKRDLYRLQNQKPLYQIRQEQFIEKHELPVILQRQAKLQQVKNSRKAFDWHQQLSEFQKRISNLQSQQRRNRASSHLNSHPAEPSLFKSRFYHRFSQQGHHANDESLKSQIQKRRKQYGREVKHYIQPHMPMRAKNNSPSKRGSKMPLDREVQIILGKQYLKYCKGSKRYRTENSTIDVSDDKYLDPNPSHSQVAYSTETLPVDSPMHRTEEEMEEHEQYLSDIRVKLKKLECI